MVRHVRLVQYNVRRLRSLARITASLVALSPQIVTLNEVDCGSLALRADLDNLAAALDLKAHFFGHVRGTYGNAVLCGAGSTAAELHLDGGTVVKKDDGTGHRIGRGLLVVDESPWLTIAVTHLDHICERERATQLESVLIGLERLSSASSPHKTVLLAGDLNALHRADYTENEWAALASRNAARGWAPPADSNAERGALNQLRRAGFVDLALHYGSAEFTSPADVPEQRIDYLHLRPAAPFSVRRAFVERSAQGSDHLPLVVDLELGASSM